MAVTGHGVDPALTAGMFVAMDEFFAQPVEAKIAAAPIEPGSPRGYTYVGATAQANAHDVATKPDLVETFNAGLDPIPDTPYYRAAAEFFAPSIWPTVPAGLPRLWARTSPPCRTSPTGSSGRCPTRWASVPTSSRR